MLQRQHKYLPIRHGILLDQRFGHVFVVRSYWILDSARNFQDPAEPLIQLCFCHETEQDPISRLTENLDSRRHCGPVAALVRMPTMQTGPRASVNSIECIEL